MNFDTLSFFLLMHDFLNLTLCSAMGHKVRGREIIVHMCFHTVYILYAIALLHVFIFLVILTPSPCALPQTHCLYSFSFFVVFADA